MFRVAIFLLATTLFLGCSKPSDFLKSYTKSSGDLRAFLIEHAPKLGLHFQQTNNLPALSCEWLYKEDGHTLYVFALGDQLGQVHSFFDRTLISITPSTTNSTTNSITVEYDTEKLGAGLTFSWIKDYTRKQEFTGIAIASTNYLKSIGN